jgi:hypothetical protein
MYFLGCAMERDETTCYRRRTGTAISLQHIAVHDNLAFT